MIPILIHIHMGTFTPHAYVCYTKMHVSYGHAHMISICIIAHKYVHPGIKELLVSQLE